MSHRTATQISARLSLRKPQRESLDILVRALDILAAHKDVPLVDLAPLLRAEWPSIEDFERDFPSLCFALATGVGKTRLMGAFIAYLYLTGRSKNFFVLAPNLTIYEKLIADFSQGSPKYVFKGIPEFAANPPKIVTGETYTRSGSVRVSFAADGAQAEIFDQTPYINVFNISKINSEVRGGSSPRIKRLQEYIGESYFDYLAGLPDLVLLMDEAHRYRASAGVKAINELKPKLGLELTATPRNPGAGGGTFKNVVYHYPLSSAMADGFVKEPAVATRKDFRAADYTQEELERIKLEDGIHHHEYVKAELVTYAKQAGRGVVKPFMLVVAQDTDHARQLRERMEGEGFFEGRYKGKVVEIHSKLRGEEEDENVQRLLNVESAQEKTEVVIHVNKLKEGWDVTNLYTIVPLRASTSEILTEQTIGRGLRLPYGERTGVESLDRLTIIAHDKFREIIDAAAGAESIIRKGVEIGPGGDIPSAKPQVVEIPPAYGALAGEYPRFDGQLALPMGEPAAAFTPEEQQAAKITLEVMRKFEHLPSSRDLAKPEIKAKIQAQVAEILKPVQGALDLGGPKPDLEKVVNAITNQVSENTIDIPDIVLLPSREVNFGFRDFDLADLDKIHYQPVTQAMLIQALRTSAQSSLTWEGSTSRESRPEDYIVRELMNRDEIDYDTHADLLYKLAGQAVGRLQAYLRDDEVENVLLYYQKPLADFVFAQMMLPDHYWESPHDLKATVSRSFTLLKSLSATISHGEASRDFRAPVEKKQDIPAMIFSGFKKCCYPMQKFGSDSERVFAIILDDDGEVLKWVKPAPKQFRIEYAPGKGYDPDFVVETKAEKWICEPKKAGEMDDPIVQAKARAAVLWCSHATEAGTGMGNGKPWRYALIPHDRIEPQMSFRKLASDHIYSH
jgi:type III restriction enzyme